MQFADLAHSILTGRWRLDRKRTQAIIELNGRADIEKRLILYAGAEPGNRRPTANQLSQPDDFKQAYERIVLIRAARQMEEDFPFFDDLLAEFENFVVGDCCYRAATGNPEADKVLNEFLEWQFSQCDFSERLDLRQIARLGIRSMKRDGECGFIPIEAGDGLKLSYLSGDRIGNPMLASGISPQDYNGIIIDLATGRITRYDIFRRLPKLNAYVFQQSVGPNNFFHYYDPFRFEQYHGVTTFKNSIEKGFDLKQIEDFTRLNIKWRASQLPTVTNEQGRPRGSGYEESGTTETGVPKPLSLDIDGVTQTFFKIGEGVVEYPNDFPNTQYLPVTTDIRRDCALAAKLPLEWLWRSEAGGVVQRFHADKAKATFDADKLLLKKTLLNPYKNRAIQWGLKTGMLDLSKFGDLATKLARFRGTWQLGRSVSVDYGREVDADIKQMDSGVMSEADYVLESQGRTIEEVNTQKEAQALAIFQMAGRISKLTGQPIEVVLPYVAKKFPNPTPATKPPGAGGPPADGAAE